MVEWGRAYYIWTGFGHFDESLHNVNTNCIVEKLWKTCGKLVENLWKTCGKIWKILEMGAYGKYWKWEAMENIGNNAV